MSSFTSVLRILEVTFLIKVPSISVAGLATKDIFLSMVGQITFSEGSASFCPVLDKVILKSLGIKLHQLYKLEKSSTTWGKEVNSSTNFKLWTQSNCQKEIWVSRRATSSQLVSRSN
jgi:hypothetical protein